MCFDLSGGFVNLKISSYRNGDYCYRQQNAMQGEWKKKRLYDLLNAVLVKDKAA